MIMPKSAASRDRAQIEHLERVQALSREMAAAISAMEQNNLPRFQAAIANQEKICHELAVRKFSSSASAGNRKDAVHQAYVELAQLNRVYAGVIKRSKRCADLLSALYGACGVGYGKDGPALADRHSWTCEV